MLLAALSGEHILFIGPPGTAKSELGRRLSRLYKGAFFERLLTRFSVPEVCNTSLPAVSCRSLGSFNLRSHRWHVHNTEAGWKLGRAALKRFVRDSFTLLRLPVTPTWCTPHLPVRIGIRLSVNTRFVASCNN